MLRAAINLTVRVFMNNKMYLGCNKNLQKYIQLYKKNLNVSPWLHEFGVATKANFSKTKSCCPFFTSQILPTIYFICLELLPIIRNF